MNERKTDWQKFVDIRMEDHSGRLVEAEKARAVFEALAKKQEEQVNDRFQRIELSISGLRTDVNRDFNLIKGSISRLAWIVIGAVALAITQWLLKGGLILP